MYIFDINHMQIPICLSLSPLSHTELYAQPQGARTHIQHTHGAACVEDFGYHIERTCVLLVRFRQADPSHVTS